MALTVEQLAEIELQLEIWAAYQEMEAANLRAEDEDVAMSEDAEENRRRAALFCDTEAAKCRGLIAAIEEELRK